jgi:hypothetical protein
MYELTGLRFGKLVVIAQAGRMKGQIAWRCRCDCGGEVISRSQNLRLGHTKSCGCSKHSGFHAYNNNKRNHARAAALKAGLKRYKGRPCHQCGLTDRFSINSKCVACSKAVVRERRKTEAGRKYSKYLSAQRRAAVLRATPSWADRAAVRQFYEHCPPGHHVDHIHPLKGRNVCGLHVLENLQYLPASENQKKHNSFEARY